jgi:hypothetical protein
MTQFAAARAKGDAALAAGNADAATIYFKAATESFNRANAVNDKAIEYKSKLTGAPTDAEAARIRALGGNPDDYQFAGGKAELVQQAPGKKRLLADDELTASEKEAGGEWQVDTKTGDRAQISATAGEKKQLHLIGKDALTGAEQYGVFDPGTGEITPYNPPGAAGGQAAIPSQIQQLEMPNADAGQGDKTPDVPLPPDQQARLAQIRPEIKGTVEKILQGRLGLPKITAGRGNALPLALSEAVFTVNPNFDANMNQNQVLARKAFNAGGSNNTPGQLILNSDAALDHMVPLVEASDALPNYGSLLGPGVVGTESMVPGNVAGEDFKKEALSRVQLRTSAGR